MRPTFALALLGVVSACKRAPIEKTARAAAPDAAAPAPAAAAVDAGGPDLAAANAKLAPFEVDRRLVAAEVPPIVDDAHALAPFHAKVRALARGEATRHVRIAVYGDSNLTTDHLTGHLRRALAARFGDGGHGFVALARPWGWYAHEDVVHKGTWPLFKQIAVTTDPVPGNRYGLAFIAAESATAGAWASVATAAPPSVVGRTASRIEVSFLRQPHGGSFDLLLDGKPLRTVTTAAADIGTGYELVDTTDDAHEVKVLLKGDGKVRLFGATLERDAPAIVVDSFGVGSMNYQRFLMADAELRREQLRHRDYDLVVVWYGMNCMWVPPNRGWAADTIAALREARPDLPIVLVSPPDSVKMGERKTDPRIQALTTQLREVAAEQRVAFWNFRAAMGGEASYLDFMKRGLAANDRAHLSKEGSAAMGQRFLSALWRYSE